MFEFIGSSLLRARPSYQGCSTFISCLACLTIGAFGPSTREASAGEPFTEPFLSFGAGINPNSVAIGDLNEDGIPDLATANYGYYGPGNTIAVLMGQGDGTFGAKSEFATGVNPRSVALGDLNGDGHLDMVTANYGPSSFSVLLGTGVGTFGANSDFATGHGPLSATLADLNGDGVLDVVTANAGNVGPDSTVSVCFGNGDGTFGVKFDYGVGVNPQSAAVGDLNEDGWPDLAVANYSSNSVTVLLNRGNGTFGTKLVVTSGWGARAVAVEDLNGDANLDLMVVDASLGGVAVLLGDGHAGFGGSQGYQTMSDPRSLVVRDIDGDANFDIAVVCWGDQALHLLLGNGDGTFGWGSAYLMGIGPCAVATGDMNSDGKPDLAVANYLSNSVTIMPNTGGNSWAGVEPAIADAGTLRLRAGPSPTMSGVAISYRLPASAEVNLHIYDLVGRRIATWTPGIKRAGVHTEQWDGRGAGSTKVNAGVYLLELDAGATRAITRVIVLR